MYLPPNWFPMEIVTFLKLSLSLGLNHRDSLQC